MNQGSGDMGEIEFSEIWRKYSIATFHFIQYEEGNLM